MGTLAGFLASVFSGLLALLASWVGKKTATVTAVAALMLSLTTGFYIVMKGLVAGVVGLVTYEPLLMAFYACWPSNAETCLTAVFSAELGAFLYRYQCATVKAVAAA